MKKDPIIYRTELESMVERLSVNNITAEIKGDGISQFIYATYGSRAAELSQDENGIWVEFWSCDSEDPKKEVTLNSYNEALIKIQSWLIA